MSDLRRLALSVVAATDPSTKVRIAAGMPQMTNVGNLTEVLDEPAGLPGRPSKPVLVARTALSQRSMATPEGHAALLHSIAHIELNAIDLAADVIWRFPAMPNDFYRQWAVVAGEEAYHFSLLRDHLASRGFTYGDFPAHNGLWEMAERTKHDVLARLALVPRTLEARGLDASLAVRAKVLRFGDHRAAEILDIILRDEIGHVAIGNYWYRYVCAQRGLDPLASYTALAEQYRAPKLRGPFNLDARRAAGFTAEELDRLDSTRSTSHDHIGNTPAADAAPTSRSHGPEGRANERGNP